MLWWVGARPHKDYIDREEGMLTGENKQHGLFGLDAEGSEDSDDEIMWQV